MPAAIIQLDRSIDKGLCFLTDHQLQNGEFVCYFSADPLMKEWCVPDSVTFITALVCNCLLPFSERPDVKTALTRSSNFIEYQRMRGGVWSFYTKWHPSFPYLPPDIDDTCMALEFLKGMGNDTRQHLPVLYANRNSKGLFYTWFTLHPTFPLHRDSWLVRLRFLKRPFKSFFYFLRNEFSVNDTDALVNANVLYYLGASDNTKDVIAYLISLFEKGQELQKDNWYQNPFIAYYLYARLFTKPVPGLAPIREVLRDRLLRLISTQEQWQDIELAVTVASLVYLGFAGRQLDELTALLLERQQSNGSWRRHFFYVVPSGSYGWGSEETTTAFAVEALNAYRNFLLIKNDLISNENR